MSRPILSAILSCSSYELTDEEKCLFAKYNPIGISLFSRNLQTKEQTKKLIESIKNVINRDDVIIAIDQEGGRVNRLEKINSHQYASANQLSQRDILYTKYHAKLISEDMREIGANVNFAPVVDVENESPVFEGRCISSNTNHIVKYASALADEYINQGICPCFKHIPGHFSNNKDPHLSQIIIDNPYEEIIKNIEYIKSFAKYPMAMTSHSIFSNIDKNNPTTTSSKVITKLIRNIISFDGFLISDAIDMHALTGNITEKTIQALDAGVDAVCYCGGKINDIYSICHEKRFMTEKSLIRFDKIKKIINITNKWSGNNLMREQYNQEFQKDFQYQYTYDATETLEKILKKGDN